MSYYLAYDCRNPSSIRELTAIIDSGREIKLSTFKKAIGIESFYELALNLGYSKDFPLEEDSYVSYYSSKDLKGNKVYYMVHSAIEYVFKNK